MGIESTAGAAANQMLRILAVSMVASGHPVTRWLPQTALTHEGLVRPSILVF